MGKVLRAPHLRSPPVTRITVNPLNRYSENSNLNIEFCVALSNVRSYAKKIEVLFFHFYFLFFFSDSIFNLKFCVGLFNAIEKSYAENEENLTLKFRCMENFPTKEPRNLWDVLIPAGLKGL